MQYPVSAQYAPLAGTAKYHHKAKPIIPKVIIPRHRFDVPIREQILDAVRSLDGPTWSEIHQKCDKEVSGKNLRSEISRMCKTSVLRAAGDDRPWRYYEAGVEIKT